MSLHAAWLMSVHTDGPLFLQQLPAEGERNEQMLTV